MKISTKGRYGLRFLMDVAVHEGGGNVTLREVSQRQAISEKYLWQVVNPLKKAGMIRSVSGPGGGYALVREEKNITLRDILVVLEGEDDLAPCTHEPDACPRSNACAARDIWREADERFSEVLDSITLAKAVEKQRMFDQNLIGAYSI